jgi:ABC-type antimicrobial peptide transport system permease subunit
MLALFFAAVGLLLAGIGLYGVLDYSVLQRRRELGIRIAVGAPGRNIARLVTVDVFSMVLLGSAVGAVAGLLLKPYIKSLLYQIGPSDMSAFAVPALTIVSAVLLAALPAVIRAVRTDAVAMLRVE